MDLDVSICPKCGGFMDWIGEKEFPEKDYACTECGFGLSELSARDSKEETTI